MSSRNKDKNSEIYNLTLAKSPHIEMDGNRSFLLNGKFTIIEYTDQLIKIKAEGRYINILGDELSITFATDTNIFVIGNIVSLEFN